MYGVWDTENIDIELRTPNLPCFKKDEKFVRQVVLIFNKNYVDGIINIS